MSTELRFRFRVRVRLRVRVRARVNARVRDRVNARVRDRGRDATFESRAQLSGAFCTREKLLEARVGPCRQCWG